MDIKPTNILVRDIRRSAVRNNSFAYKVYIADFGIARSYLTAADSETENPTGFTRKYAAPEVVEQEKRGFSADISSLSCVLLEIIAATSCSIKRDSRHNPDLYSKNHRDFKQWMKTQGKSSDPRQQLIECLS